MSGVATAKASLEYPPFQLNKPRFGQGTFLGRYRHFLDIIDPRTLLTTKEQLEDAIKLLEDFKAGRARSDVTDKELWHAQKIKQAIIHPDTGKKIFMPFRMSGYVPFGTPTVVGLLLPNQTLATTVFWQWLNQSHNACVNFANRNATKETPTRRFVFGYIGAVSSACSIAVGLNVFINKSSSLGPTGQIFVKRFVPFPAVALANICNVTLMRYNELWEGIEVMDSEGNVLGTSMIAAKSALIETAMTRVVLPAPVLLLPPIIMTFIENRTKFLKRFPRMHFPLQVLVCTASFGFALPLAISMFPQMAEDIHISLEDVTTPPDELPTTPDHINEWKDIPDVRQRNCLYITLEFLEKGFGQIQDSHRKILRWLFYGLLLFLYSAYLVFVLMRDFEAAFLLLVLTIVVIIYFAGRQALNRWGDTAKKMFLESKCMEASVEQKRVLKWLIYGFLIAALLSLVAATRVFHSWVKEPRRMISVLGLFTMLLLSLLCSQKPTKIRWRTVFWGVYLQIFFGVLILRTKAGFDFFQLIGNEVEFFLSYTKVGAEFVFGPEDLALRSFLFEILPVIIFTSAMFALFYHIGVMQVVISAFAHIMHLTMGVSGAESFGAASNVFVGCSTAPLAIKPYLNDFTKSEMHSLMVGGFATIAGSVLAVYIKFGVSAAHLLSASIMSAPASLVVAKMFIPETAKPKTANHATISVGARKSENIFEALYTGAIDGLKICGYIIANILTIICVLALVNNILQWLGALAGVEGLSFQLICRYVLYPLAWILGTDPEDCQEVAELIGIKTFLNEFIAYKQLSDYIKDDTISTRSQIIVTYAICGFSHIGNIGVLLGGLAPLVPDRVSEVSSLCLRALIAACIACFMTACVAGFLYDEERRYHGESLTNEMITTLPSMVTTA